jgi:hypothetical protein
MRAIKAAAARIGEAVRNNPARVYSVISTLLALAVTLGYTELPVTTILALVSALLGGGEVVRANVTPVRK